MPALPSVPKVLRVDLHYTVGGDTFAKNRFFLQYAGTAPSNTNLNDLAEETTDQFGFNLQSLMNVDTALSKVEITDLTAPTAAFGTHAEVLTGTRAGAVVTADSCVLESLSIARRYRGGHPRIYWPFGVSADLQTLQTWTNALVAAVAAGLAGFYATLEAAVWAGGVSLQQVSVSYYHLFTVTTGTTGRARNVSTPRAMPLVDFVTGDNVRNGVATQRKRLLRLA